MISSSKTITVAATVVGTTATAVGTGGVLP